MTEIKENSVLVITGMHRSGTSLTANWLMHSGLHVGDFLVEAESGNPWGHYEDWDFVHFHEDLLNFNHENYLLDDKVKLEVPEYFQQRAKHLLSFKNSLQDQWAWKDPRTSLFLPFWKEQIGEAKYLFLFRKPDDVMNSLYQRELKRIKKSRFYPVKYFKLWLNKKKLCKKYEASYNRYNKDIISFIEELSDEDYLLVSNESLKECNDQIMKYMELTWGFTFKENAFQKIFQKEGDHSMKEDKLNNKVYQQLKEKETYSLNQLKSIGRH